jgi:hypothetical protein
MQQHYLTRSFNIILLTTCLVMLYVSINQLFVNPYTPSLSSELPLVGKVLEASNTVKVKKAHLFSWNSVGALSPLNDQDLLFTYKDSEGEIMLGDEKSVMIFPETLIQINSNYLNISKGKAEFKLLKRNASISIILGNRKFKIKGDKARVVIEHKNNSSTISVKEGSIQVEEENQQAIEVNTEQQLNVTNTDLEVHDTSFELISPKNISFVTQNSFLKVPFEFNLNNAAKLVISSNKTFTDLVSTVEATANKEVELPKGSYYWRLEAQDNTSQREHFEIYQELPSPQLITPLNNFIQNYYLEKTKINFNWKPVADAQGYIIEISDEAGNLVYSSETRHHRWSWVTKQQGIFYWKVKAFGDYIQGIWSDLQKLELKKEYFDETRPVVVELKRPNQKVTFNWQEGPTTTTFTLARDPGLKDIITVKKLKRNKIDITFPETGIFYWKATSHTKDGLPIVNKPVKVLIKPTPPPSKPKKLPNLKIKVKNSFHNPWWSFLLPIAHAAEFGTANLEWPSIEDARLYEIEIYSDPNLQNKIDTITTSKNKTRWKVPRHGTFYWRFRYQDYWNRFSPFSDSSSLEILPTEAMKRPKKKIVKKTDLPLKKKVTPVAIEKKQVKKILITKAKKSRQLLLALTPSLVSYRHKADSIYKIDGTALNGLYLGYHHDLNVGSIHAHFNTITGIVFDDAAFAQRDLSADYHYRYSSDWSFSAGATFAFFDTYQDDGTTVENDNNISGIGARFGATYSWRFYPTFPINFNVSLLQGPLSGFNFGLSHEYLTKSRFSYLFKLSVESLDLDDGTNDISSQQNQIFAGVKYSL